MSKCTSILKSMDWCQGKPARPGIKRRIFYALIADIMNWPGLDKDELGRIISATYKGNFSLAEGVKFQSIDHLADKAEFKSEIQGEYPSQTFKNTITVVHPGIGPEAAAATAAMLNSNIVVLVEDMEGRFRVVGSQYYDTKVTISRDNGQGPTGTAGTTITFEASDLVDSPFYEGEIPTEDGIINEGGAGSKD